MSEKKLNNKEIYGLDDALERLDDALERIDELEQEQKEGFERYRRGYNDGLDYMIMRIADQIEADRSFKEIARSVEVDHLSEYLDDKDKLAEKLKEFYQGEYL